MKRSVKKARLRELKEQIISMKQGGNQDLDQAEGVNNDNEEDVHEQFISKFTAKEGSTIADRRLQK